MYIKGLGLKPVDFTASGLPSVDINAMRALAGSPNKGEYGTAYTQLK